jgi:ribosomal protein L40E
MMRVHGWTICSNHGSDRPAYEADIKVCAHCGRTLFMCDGESRKPLPADTVMERCGNCDKHVCRRCKWKLNSGAAVCEPFVAAIDRAEEAYAMRKHYG